MNNVTPNPAPMTYRLGLTSLGQFFAMFGEEEDRASELAVVRLPLETWKRMERPGWVEVVVSPRPALTPWTVQADCTATTALSNVEGEVQCELAAGHSGPHTAHPKHQSGAIVRRNWT